MSGTAEIPGAEPFDIFVGNGWLAITRRAAGGTHSELPDGSNALSSLGPFDRDAVLDTFEEEWPVELLSRRADILAFLDGDDPLLMLMA